MPPAYACRALPTPSGGAIVPWGHRGTDVEAIVGYQNGTLGPWHPKHPLGLWRADTVGLAADCGVGWPCQFGSHASHLSKKGLEAPSGTSSR